MSISPKELALNQKLHNLVEGGNMPEVTGLPAKLLSLLIENSEIKAIQDYANTVSITRLGLNDHGPVHMKTVCRNALKMLKLLHEAGVKTSLETEEAGSFADSAAAVAIAGFLHDVGMTIGRKGHELYSGIISHSLIKEITSRLIPEDIRRRIAIQSLAMEGILGHMTTRPIHSIEAGLILIADGCDMTKGRARIPLERPSKPTSGDIHKYSANAIESVHIRHGSDCPIKIEISMKSEVGFFQVEEVLIPKIMSSPARHLVELYAGVSPEDMKRYI
mgnify:CR=1 FL=1